MFTKEVLAEKYDYPISDNTPPVFNSAAEKAGELQHNYIGTEHLLLGLLRTHPSFFEPFNTGNTKMTDQIDRAIRFIIGRGDRAATTDIDMTPRANKAIELGVDEAKRLQDSLLLPGHILLGLIREGEGIAAGALESQGITLDRTRENLLRDGEVGSITQSRIVESSLAALVKLRQFLKNPDEDFARKVQIQMILEGTVGLISSRKSNKPRV